MKPIWYFVGLILTAMGVVITAAGIYILFNPPVVKTVLAEINPNIWWGSIMVVSGILFILKNRNVRV